MLPHRENEMKWAERFYYCLLWLYPDRHRHTYGPLMTQLFLDQLRDARSEGRWSVLALWLQTMLDVLLSAPAEHLRQSSIVASDKPLLSWRSALIMLIPALLVMIPWLPIPRGSQVILSVVTCAMLMTTLLVWKKTRSIPIWGMPLLGAATGVMSIPLSIVPVLAWVLVIGLFVYYSRRRSIPLSAWGLLGIYILTAACTAVIYMLNVSNIPLSDGLTAETWQGILINLFGALVLFSYSAITLVPVALGLLLAQRQGVGALIFAASGMMFFHQFFDVDYLFSFYYHNLSVLTLYNVLWRLLVFVIAPLWMVRSRSNRGRLIGIGLPILVAVSVEMIANHATDSSMTVYTLLRGLAVMVVQPMSAIGIAYLLYRHSDDALVANRESGLAPTNNPINASRH